MLYIKKIQYLAIVISFFILIASVAQAQDEKSLNPEIAQLIREVPLKQEYTDAGAVILLREGVMSVEKDGLRNITAHVVGKILDNKAASDYGQISVISNSYYEEAALDFAHTINKDGTIIEVSKDAIQLKTPPEQPGVKRYTDVKVLTFSPPALEPGSVFEYQVRIRQKKPVIENKWHESFNFNYTLHKLSPPYIPRIDPVYKSRFVLKVTEGEKFIYDVERAKVSPANGKEGDFTTYTWEVKDLPVVSIEDYMPFIENIIPMIKLSSLTEWEEIDKWAGRLFFPKIEVTEEIKAKAGEITGEAKTEKEKIEALFYFVQSNIEYIQADLNSGGYIPHSANDILKNRYGDCKDQAILLLSMLRAVGISAYPAFINTYSEVNKKIPSPEAFNHLIVYIPRGEGDLWLDTISGVTEFPYLYWIYQDRWAFVINGKGGKFLRTPALKPERNQGIIKSEFSFKEETIQGKIIIEGIGAISENLKSFLKLLPPVQQKDIIRNTIKSLFPLIARSQTISVEISDLKNPRLPFKATVLFEIKDLQKKIMEWFSYTSKALPISFFTNIDNLPQPENRKNDYVLVIPHSLCCGVSSYPHFGKGRRGGILN